MLYGSLPTRRSCRRFDAELRARAQGQVPHHRPAQDACRRAATRWTRSSPAVAAMSMFYPGDHVNDAEFRNACVIRLIAKFPTIVAAWQRIRNGDDPIKSRADLGHAANFLYMLNGEEPDPLIARTMDVALILHAEHQMNASTFTARVTGSTLADPYAVVSAAIGTCRARCTAAPTRRCSRCCARSPTRAPSTVRAVGRGPARAQAEDHRLRPPRVQGQGSARDDPAEARRARVREARQHAALRHRGRARAPDGRPGRRQGHLPERRFLQRHRLRQDEASRPTCSRRSSRSRASPAGSRTGSSSCTTTASSARARSGPATPSTATASRSPTGADSGYSPAGSLPSTIGARMTRRCCMPGLTCSRRSLSTITASARNGAFGRMLQRALGAHDEERGVDGVGGERRTRRRP